MSERCFYQKLNLVKYQIHLDKELNIYLSFIYFLSQPKLTFYNHKNKNKKTFFQFFNDTFDDILPTTHSYKTTDQMLETLQQQKTTWPSCDLKISVFLFSFQFPDRL